MQDVKLILRGLSLNKYTIIALLLLLVTTGCSTSCSDIGVRKEEPCLLSLVIKKADNPHVRKNIEFVEDADGNTFCASYLNWLDTDTPDFFIPTFNFKGDRITVNDEEVVSGETRISLAEDAVCSVYSGNEKRDYILSLVCPQINTELPVLRIDLDVKNIKEEYEFVETRVNLFEPSSGKEKWNYDAGTVNIRGRGNSTWVLPKKPYRIKFPVKINPTINGNIKAKNWVLLAHDMDKSLIRNHLGFCIARYLTQVGGGKNKVFVPCSEFINVYFKDNYQGLYQLTDHIERDDSRVDVEKLDYEIGDTPDVITGGYMLETVINIDNPSVHFSTNKGFGIDYKYPKKEDHRESQYEYIKEFVNNAEDILYSELFDDKEEGWRRYFDEQSLIDYIITKEIAGDVDGYVSTRLYKKRNDEKLYFGPVWDIDKGWGNDNRNPFPQYPPSLSLMIFGGFRMCGKTETDWFCRFWQDVEFRNAVLKRYLQVKEGVTTVILSEIDRCERTMGKSIRANFEKWPFNEQASEFASQPAMDYASELNVLRERTVNRVALLEKLFEYCDGVQ